MILGHFRDLLQPDSPRQGEEDVKTPESSLDSTLLRLSLFEKDPRVLSHGPLERLEESIPG